MDELEVKAAKLLENSKEATIKETKSMIDAEAKSLTEKLDAETKSRGELAIKFEAIESELKEVKSESQRLKVAAETKTTTWSEGLKSAFDDASNLTNLHEFKDKKIKQFTMEVKTVGDMSLSNITGLSAANVEMLPGIVPFPSRKLHIRQLLPIGQMSTSDIHFLKESQDEGTVAVWADNSGAKNQVDFDLTEEVAQSQFIAGYLRITRKMLDDIPAMRSFLQARLIERYLNAEDQQLLSGTGVSPQLDGLITNAQAYSGARTIAVEKIIDACAQVEGNNYQATGILLSPKQYYAILMTRGTTNEYSLPGGSSINVVNGQIYIAGVPVFKSTALFTQLPAQDTFLVGDWAMGAQLFIRENPIVRFFEEDGTNVRENKITVRVEGRVAMPIYSPTAFVTGSLNPTPS
jgi:HK97 family phage major capsid protein